MKFFRRKLNVCSFSERTYDSPLSKRRSEVMTGEVVGRVSGVGVGRVSGVGGGMVSGAGVGRVSGVGGGWAREGVELLLRMWLPLCVVVIQAFVRERVIS